MKFKKLFESQNFEDTPVGGLTHEMLTSIPGAQHRRSGDSMISMKEPPKPVRGENHYEFEEDGDHDHSLAAVHKTLNDAGWRGKVNYINHDDNEGEGPIVDGRHPDAGWTYTHPEASHVAHVSHSWPYTTVTVRNSR